MEIHSTFWKKESHSLFDYCDSNEYCYDKVIIKNSGILYKNKKKINFVYHTDLAYIESEMKKSAFLLYITTCEKEYYKIVVKENPCINLNQQEKIWITIKHTFERDPNV